MSAGTNPTAGGPEVSDIGKNPFHPSLEFQPKGKVWTVAIGRSYRVIARRVDDDLHWVWIGSHEAYNNILQKLK